LRISNCDMYWRFLNRMNNDTCLSILIYLVASYYDYNGGLLPDQFYLPTSEIFAEDPTRTPYTHTFLRRWW
mgnify:CR=1